jgi:S-ribosylhomocysteine lyase LuxS involved in autoinducer biosynthesis
LSETLLALAQLLVAVSTLVGTLTGIYLSLRNHKGIAEIHHATNSMKDELVKEVRASSIAEGREQVKTENAENAAAAGAQP